MLIEQAIFTSAKTDRAQGYQLVARSPGLSDELARELSVWGPSHDSLLASAGTRGSTNFFPLGNGDYCVSRTSTAGAEYSGRGGASVHTRFLVVPPAVLVRFANNPFALLRAATAIGAMEVTPAVSSRLESLRLGGRSAPVDMGLLAHLARDPGAAVMATLVQTALASDRLAVASQSPCEQMLAGLMTLLPMECRTEFSFTTGLKLSPSRPVRIAPLPDDEAGWKAIARGGVTLLDVRDPSLMADVSWEGWAGCVAQILQSGKFSLLASQLDQARPWLNTSNLHMLSDQVQAHLAAAGRSRPIRSAVPSVSESAKETASDSCASVERFEAAHEQQSGPLAEHKAAPSGEPAGPTATAPEAVPEVLELLERIDDLVFSAIAGDDRAVTELEVLWPAVIAELDDCLVEQSREQYLRCALSICRECVDGDDERPERAVAAIDVLCVLFEDR